MLDPDTFIQRCIDARAAGEGPSGIAALVREALASQREHPAAWGRKELLHAADDLMIVDLTLPPFATSAIHEHLTWAVIGISEGCEVDELLVENGDGLARTSRHELHAGDVLVLPPDCIHFIGNPAATPARGLHVYGRHLGLTERRMWDPVTAQPRRMDFAVFEQWEHQLTARSAAEGRLVAPAWRHA